MRNVNDVRNKKTSMHPLTKTQFPVLSMHLQTKQIRCNVDRIFIIKLYNRKRDTFNKFLILFKKRKKKSLFLHIYYVLTDPLYLIGKEKILKKEIFHLLKQIRIINIISIKLTTCLAPFKN